MFRVAICDDEATSLQIIEALTEQILQEAEIEYEIATFEDMLVMTKELSSGRDEYHLLLSDILAVGMTGIEAAEELRRLGEKIPIVFVSSTAEYAMDGYRVHALRYLKKPVEYERLQEALLEAYRMSMNSSGFLKFQVADKLYNLPFEQIEYLESQGRDTNIITAEETISVHMKFSDMEQQLPADTFLRCHRSYIINLAHVKDLARYRFLTKSGVEIPVSQLQYAEIKNKFMKY
ncbi:MAG: response regulator transcription factor [Lachnospiraceae bacterium]|nr:response regulator transcription factor [Lachnospiraceae bacterium]